MNEIKKFATDKDCTHRIVPYREMEKSFTVKVDDIWEFITDEWYEEGHVFFEKLPDVHPLILKLVVKVTMEVIQDIGSNVGKVIADLFKKKASYILKPYDENSFLIIFPDLFMEQKKQKELCELIRKDGIQPDCTIYSSEYLIDINMDLEEVVNEKGESVDIKMLSMRREGEVYIDTRDRDMIDGKLSIYSFMRKYNGKQIGPELLKDLKTCCAYIMDFRKYYVRIDKSRYQFMTTKDMLEMMKPYKLTWSKDGKEQSEAMFNIIEMARDEITFTQSFFRPRIGNKLNDFEDSIMFNTFQGYRYSYSIEKEYDYSILGKKDDEWHKSLFGFIHQILCNNDEQIEEIVLNWLRLLFQKPDELPRVALFPISDEGNGKNLFFGEFIGKLCIGVTYSLLNGKLGSMTGGFNAMIHNKSYCIINESELKEKHMDTLKTYITDSPIQITPKGVDEFSAENYLHIVILSNKYDQHISPRQRRIFAWIMNNLFAGTQYVHLFDELAKYLLRPEVANAFVHWLLNTKITKDVRSFHQTQFMVEVSNAYTPAHEYLDEQFDCDYPKGNANASEFMFKMNEFIDKRNGKKFETSVSFSQFVLGFNGGKSFKKHKSNGKIVYSRQ